MTRGRRPNLSLEPSRQLLVQRAFRERKAAHLRNLEESVQRLERENAALKQALGVEGDAPVDGDVKEETDDAAESSTNASTKRKRTKSNAAKADDEGQSDGKSGGCCGSNKSAADAGCSSSNGPSSSANPSQPRAPAFCPRCFERDRNKEEITTAIGQVDFHLATLATAMVQLRTVLGRTGGPQTSSLPTPTAMEWSTSIGRSAANAASSHGKPDEEELARTLSMFANPSASAPNSANAPDGPSSTAPSPAVYTLGSMNGATQNLIATMRRGQRRQTVGPTSISSMPSPSASSSRAAAAENAAWGHDMSPPSSAHPHSTPSPASQYGGGAIGTSSARSTFQRQGSTGHGVPDYGHGAGMHARRTSSSTEQGGTNVMHSPIEPASPHQTHMTQYATPGASSSASSSYAGLGPMQGDNAKRLSASSSTSSGSNATSPYDARTPQQPQLDGRSRQSSLNGHHAGPAQHRFNGMPSYMSLSGSMHHHSGGINGMSMPMPNPALANPTLESELGGAVAAAAAAAAAAADAASTAAGGGNGSTASNGGQYYSFSAQQQQHHHHQHQRASDGTCPRLADDACCLGLFSCDDDGRVLL